MADNYGTQEAKPGLGVGASLKREKYWKELKSDEKIERMRIIVKSLVATIDNINRDFLETKSFLWDHAHEENGNVVIKIKKDQRYRLENNHALKTMMGSPVKESDETYF